MDDAFTFDKIKNNCDDKINYYNCKVKDFITQQPLSIQRHLKPVKECVSQALPFPNFISSSLEPPTLAGFGVIK